MPKRSNDTEKWKERFFKKLPPEYKLLWLYMWDDCDHAGIWNVDFESANFRIGYKEILNCDDAKKYFGDEIVEIENGEKWFMPRFVEVTCGLNLNDDNTWHKSVLTILAKYNLHKDFLYGKGLPY